MKVTSSPVADSIPFDNSTNGFTATNVQKAIEEISLVGTANLPEYLVDPSSPTAGETWVLRSPVAGSPIGLLLALTNATNGYKLSYRTTEGTTVRAILS